MNLSDIGNIKSHFSFSGVVVFDWKHKVEVVKVAGIIRFTSYTLMSQNANCLIYIQLRFAVYHMLQSSMLKATSHMQTLKQLNLCSHNVCHSSVSKTAIKYKVC